MLFVISFVIVAVLPGAKDCFGNDGPALVCLPSDDIRSRLFLILLLWMFSMIGSLIQKNQK